MDYSNKKISSAIIIISAALILYTLTGKYNPLSNGAALSYYYRVNFIYFETNYLNSLLILLFLLSLGIYFFMHIEDERIKQTGKKMLKKVWAFGSKVPNRFKRIKLPLFNRSKIAIAREENSYTEEANRDKKNVIPKPKNEEVIGNILFLGALFISFLISALSSFYIAFFLLFSLYLGKTFEPKTKVKMFKSLIFYTLFWLAVLSLAGAKVKQAQEGYFVLSYGYYFGKSLAAGIFPCIISFLISFYFINKRHKGKRVRWGVLLAFVVLANVMAVIVALARNNMEGVNALFF